ncbi:ATP-binding protein [Myxococcota bacterium]|nr:ATP-binding protein [Myxococcota bacterium]
MLIDFYVENFLSFKDGVNFTMLADTQSKQERPDAVIKVGKYELLRSAGLWGPNAGGKSNFLKALSVMSLMVHGVHINSLKNSILPVTKFKLNESCDEKPTTFEVRFLLQSVLWQGSSIDMVFRYGIQYTA